MNRFKLYLAALLSFYTLTTYAQTADSPKTKHNRNFYIRPFAGLGLSNINESTNNPIIGTVGYDPVTSIVFGIDGGIALGHFRFGTGIRYLTSGGKYSVTFILFQSNSIDTIFASLTHKHIIIPVSFGYQLNLNNSFAIVPELNIMPGFNTGYTSKVGSNLNDHPTKKYVPISSTNLKSFILWGNTTIHFEYKLNDRLSISVSPSYSRMLTNSLDPPPGSIYKVTEKHYSITGNAGVLIRL